ncbi:hypothetical protein EVAR_49921_1 [Eumeta japonica]|uniref:Uncharacterized protein n=1 Tax=Eumeta variegata TaxID=151549 RepID=A0A4C1Y555_EUMVA|nr:hypothetical protein EVAR_49921_1 [Eumeta japonica]
MLLAFALSCARADYECILSSSIDRPITNPYQITSTRSADRLLARAIHQNGKSLIMQARRPRVRRRRPPACVVLFAAVLTV